MNRSQFKLTPLARCPQCFTTIDGATAMFANGEKPREPQPGDFTVCVYCEIPLRFFDGGGGIIMLRQAEDSETPDYVKRDLHRLICAVKILKQKRPL